MRRKVNKLALTLMLVLCMTASIFVAVQAADAIDSHTVEMTPYTTEELTSLNGATPSKSGYLFGGWYSKNNDETSYLKTIDGVTDTIYAKFVPEDVLSIKAQLSASDYETNDGEANLRFVTTVDSLMYKQVGFEVSYVKDGTKQTVTRVSNNVYPTLFAVDGADGETMKEYTAKSQFCGASEYFKACTVVGIGSALYDMEFTVTPFWVTLDGTTVKGVTAVKTVCKGMKKLDDVYVASTGSDVNGQGTSESPYATLKYAMYRVADNGNICLKDDIEAQTTAIIEDGMNVTVKNAAGVETTVYRGTGLKASNLFSVTSGSELTIKDVTLDGRTATDAAKTIQESDYDTLKGYIEAATANSASSTFLISNRGTVNFDGATVQYVRRTSNGAVIMCFAGSTTKTSNGATFKYNEGAIGGVIYGPDGSTVNLQNATFEKNYATNVGGVIFITGSKSVLSITENCKFIGNVSVNNGGAIRIAAGIKKAEVANSTFKSNKSTAGNGGAIHTSTTMTVDSSSFTENNASKDGGAICVADNATSTVTVCTFESNTTTTGNGGAVYSKKDITVESSEFTGNTAEIDGGAIYMSDGTTSTVTGCTFETNTATTGNGGAVSTQKDLNVVSSGFTGNTAKVDGGAICITTGVSASAITNCTFESNASTTGYGGAIRTQKDMTVDNSSFKANKASTLRGGAIYSHKGAVLTLKAESGTDKAICQKNTAAVGGAICIGTGTLNATGYTFDGNYTSTASGGGAITLNNEAITANLKECVFVSNKAQKAGAILAECETAKGSSVVTITDCSFGGTTSDGTSLGNIAADNSEWENKGGGAIWANTGVTINLVGNDSSKAYFEKNTSNVYGGAICFQGTLTGSGYRFTENEPYDIYGEGGTNDYTVDPKLCIELSSQFNSEFGLDYKAQMDMFKKSGFDAYFFGWTSTTDVKALTDYSQSIGLECQSMHAPFTNAANMWKESTSTEAQTAVNELLNCVQLCGTYDIPIMVCHAYYGFGSGTANDYGVQNFKTVVEKAEELGVRIAFENAEGSEYLTTLMEAFKEYDNVGFCWDTGHEICYNGSTDMMAKYGDKIFCTHLNDNLGVAYNEDGTITFLDDLHLLPFDGKADWDSIISRLKNARNVEKYDGILTFELNITSKEGRTENDMYKEMGADAYFAEAYARAFKIANEVEY